MNHSRFAGDEHVSNVYYTLNYKLQSGKWPAINSIGVLETSKYLWSKFPNPTSITNKFHYDQPDKHFDLSMIWNNESKPINLFYIQGNNAVQPKNLGARSFLEKYFLAQDLQNEFNYCLEKHYSDYLFNMLAAKGIFPDTSERKNLKKQVSYLYTHFDEAGNDCRDTFLFALREDCYTLLLQSYNDNQAGFENAFKTLLMVKETNIITRIHRNHVSVEEFHAQITKYSEIMIYKKGRNSIGIQFGNLSLLLRFKFENKPGSSIKLATSYELFEDHRNFATKIRKQNIETIQAMDLISMNIKEIKKENTSNAVGKCHEAFCYYWMLQRFPDAIQTDNEECMKYLQIYLPSLSKEVAQQIKDSSSATADTIASYLWDTYHTQRIESIQIVADIYISDRLNTGDLKVSIRIEEDKIKEVYLSLKALRSASQKITTKNPGVGTILGSTYFGLVDDFSQTILAAKNEFDIHRNHQTSLIRLSSEVGSILVDAPQESLRNGIENLLGKALTVITIYEKGTAYYLKHQHIDSDVWVKPSTPSPIQTTLEWNHGNESLSLRMKFSKGQQHGWSTVKLASEYSFSPPK
jgi:hypothetical protein